MVIYCQTPTEFTFPIVTTTITMTSITLTKIKRGKKVNTVEFEATGAGGPLLPYKIYFCVPHQYSNNAKVSNLNLNFQASPILVICSY